MGRDAEMRERESKGRQSLWKGSKQKENRTDGPPLHAPDQSLLWPLKMFVVGAENV